MNYLILILVILFSLNVSSESFDEKIKKFLLNNPEIILESLENYEKKQISEKQKLNSQIIADNRKQIFNTSNGMYSGNLDSKNVIIEFFDYNCSYCKKAHEDILKIEQNKKNIKVIYKNFPILSESSKKLAEIALFIAKDNNEKFIKFHNLIMSRKGLINKSQLKDILDDLGYDESKLKDNLNSEYIKNQLLKDRELAEKLSLRGTPAFVIGDELIFGYINHEEIISKLF